MLMDHVLVHRVGDHDDGRKERETSDWKEEKKERRLHSETLKVLSQKKHKNE